MGNKKTLILIDGHALAFRQYYALERTNMQTKDGTPTWAVYGFFKAIFDLLKNENLKPDAIAVAFDVSHHTFRTEEYSEYKANRESMPDSMQIQMGLIYEGLKAFNIPIYTKPGFEADDVIGTISRQACELGHQVYILTGDQDSFQLIRENGCIKVIIPSKGELLEYDWNRVHDKLGVYPNQVIDYKALRGDTSDNIPGIKGIGEKTAVKLLEEFKTVDNVLSSADKIEGNSIREKVKNGVEIAKLSKHLATIVQNVDISFDFDKTKIELPDITVVTEYLRALQFYAFLKNIEYILKLFNKGNNTELPTLTLSQNNQNNQLGLFAQAVQQEVNKNEIPIKEAIIVNTTDIFEKALNDLSDKKVLGITFFADINNAVNVEIYGLAIGYNPDYTYNEQFIIKNNNSETTTYYIPFDNTCDNKLDIKDIIPKLRQIIESSNIKKIFHNTGFQYLCLNSIGIIPRGIIYDTMLSCYIKDSNTNSSFDIQCMEQINHILTTMVSNNKKSTILSSDETTIKKYTSDYITSLFKLTAYWKDTLDTKENTLLTAIEIPLAIVLSEMEINGVSIDKEYLNELTNDFNSKLVVLETKIYELAGEKFNINSPKQVGIILFEKLNIQIGKKRGKTKNSTSADVLEKLAEEHEIAKLIIEYRKYSKLKSTYTDSLPALIEPLDNRIHTTYNQTVTATGRLSSSNPNLQNIPARTEDGNKIRKAFVPKDKENYLIMSADYSQIELRLLAHVSEDTNLINAFNSDIDIHTLTASKVFGVDIKDVTKQMRYTSKAVNFGIVYGQSKYGLAKALNITPDEAEKFINAYFETYPRIKDYMINMVRFVEENGYVESILGRKRYLEKEINSPNGMIREFAKRAAINHPMQSSASDLIKIAMIDFSNKLKENNLKSKLIIQVHDELVIEVKKSELDIVKKLVLNAMEQNQPLKVPLKIDINTGESWKES